MSEHDPSQSPNQTQIDPSQIPSAETQQPGIIDSLRTAGNGVARVVTGLRLRASEMQLKERHEAEATGKRDADLSAEPSPLSIWESSRIINQATVRENLKATYKSQQAPRSPSPDKPSKTDPDQPAEKIPFPDGLPGKTTLFGKEVYRPFSRGKADANAEASIRRTLNKPKQRAITMGKGPTAEKPTSQLETKRDRLAERYVELGGKLPVSPEETTTPTETPTAIVEKKLRPKPPELTPNVLTLVNNIRSRQRREYGDVDNVAAFEEALLQVATKIPETYEEKKDLEGLLGWFESTISSHPQKKIRTEITDKEREKRQSIRPSKKSPQDFSLNKEIATAVLDVANNRANVVNNLAEKQLDGGVSKTEMDYLRHLITEAVARSTRIEYLQQIATPKKGEGARYKLGPSPQEIEADQLALLRSLKIAAAEPDPTPEGPKLSIVPDIDES